MTLRFLAPILVGFGIGLPPQVRFHADTDAVAVEVSVYRNGTFVPGLTHDRFSIVEDGVPQRVLDVTTEPLPLEILLLLDVSDSLDRPSIRARSRIEALAASKIALVTEADILRVGWFRGKLSSTPSNVRASAADSQTALYDAITEALLQPKLRSHRRALVLLTDGFDTISALERGLRNQVVDRAETSILAFRIASNKEHDLVASFGSGRPSPHDDYLRDLRDMTERTGGFFETVDPADDFTKRLAARLNELRARYIVRYSPEVRRSGWRAIDVKVRGGRFDIHHRKGYWRQ